MAEKQYTNNNIPKLTAIVWQYCEELERMTFENKVRTPLANCFSPLTALLYKGYCHRRY